MSEQIEQGQLWLAQLLTLMGVPGGVQCNQSAKDGAYWLTIDEQDLSPEQIEWLIGDRGKLIDTIQYLANTLLNASHNRPVQHPYTVELAGYRVRRQAELETLVDQVAQKVRATGQEVELTDLSAAERRQIHNSFKESEDLTTESRGSEPHRRLFVLRRKLR
jgi:spoIIIJ-associated protein